MQTTGIVTMEIETIREEDDKRVALVGKEPRGERAGITSLHGWRKTHRAGRYKGYFDFKRQ